MALESWALVLTVVMSDTHMPASAHAVREDSCARAALEQLKLLIYLNQFLLSICILLDYLTICL